mgnify:CR=1 FL=1
MPVTRVSEVRIRRNMTIIKMSARDDTGVCQFTWFNQPYLRQMFKPGDIQAKFLQYYPLIHEYQFQ